MVTQLILVQLFKVRALMSPPIALKRKGESENEKIFYFISTLVRNVGSYYYIAIEIKKFNIHLMSYKMVHPTSSVYINGVQGGTYE